MRKFTRLAAFIFALAAMPVLAGPLSLQYHATSSHLSDRAPQNFTEATPGFGIRYTGASRDFDVQTGFYRNEVSVNTKEFFSYYAIGDYTPVKSSNYRLGAYAGFVSGYDNFSPASSKTSTSCIKECDDKHPVTKKNTVTTPFSVQDTGVSMTAGLVAIFELDKFNFTVRYKPELTHTGPAVLSTEIGISF